jgi:hypothetical protein
MNLVTQIKHKKKFKAKFIIFSAVAAATRPVGGGWAKDVGGWASKTVRINIVIYTSRKSITLTPLLFVRVTSALCFMSSIKQPIL